MNISIVFPSESKVDYLITSEKVKKTINDLEDT